MARNIVLLLDGTGNEIGKNLSNVLKLFRVLRKTPEQLVYYDPGVGTMGQPGWWTALKQQVRGVLGLALALGLDDNLLDAYSWLARTWQPGDRIYIFGFSRGAYTARALAGFMHLCGLLGPDQLNLCGYALVAYKRSGDEDDFSIGETFKRVSGARQVPIRFIGVWDTVASVLVPRRQTAYIPAPQTLLFTRTNPSVEIFRQAASMDERRRMFRLNHWKDPQPYKPSPYDRSQDCEQDIRQVWFAGVHSDVGGGYPEVESGLSKYPLLWMVGEAAAAGLDVDPVTLAHLGEGDRGHADSRHPYVPPNPKGELHQSLTGFWWLLEPWPQRIKEKEWPRRRSFLGWYIPWAEPRPIPNRPWKGKPAQEPFLVHSSVLARIAECPDYRPVNLPADYQVETAAGPPPVPVPPSPYRRPGPFARLRGALTTWPGGKGWLGLLKEAAWLVPLLALLGWFGGFLRWQPDFGPDLWLVALVAFFVPALVEEAVFRGLLLKPPSDGATQLGPVALTSVLFALWHPLQCLLWDPPWEALGSNLWFIAGTAALGVACARLVLATRSLWPAVALHWLVVVAWKALAGGPGLPWTP